MCEAIEAEADGRPAILVGLSLGGYVAIDAAEAYPERVAGLVLAGCSAEPVGATAWPFRAMAAGASSGRRGAGSTVANRALLPAALRPPDGAGIVAGGFWSAGGAAALRSLVGRRYLDRLARL